MPARRFGASAAIWLAAAHLATAQAVQPRQPALDASGSEPPPVAKSLDALDVLLSRYVATRSIDRPGVGPPVGPVTERAQAALARLRGLSANWPAQSPVDYRTNLDRTVRRLQPLLEGKDQTKAAEALEALAEDLEAKLEHCLKSGGKLGGSVTVRVRTVRGGQEVPNWQVFYLPRVLETLGDATADRFPQLSSPTHERLVPGRYVMWSAEPTSGRLSTKTIVKVGEGRRDLTLDLVVPGN